MSNLSGKQVTIEYIIRLSNQIAIDSNIGREPLTYIHGTGQIFPILEKNLEEMKLGETRVVEVKPEDGYGFHNPDATKEVDKSLIPPEALKVGSKLKSVDSSGRPVHPFVAEIKEDKVVLDFNHPLAGETAYYEIKLLGVHDLPDE